MERITKPQIKEIKVLLRDKKTRDAIGLFVVEGKKIIEDIIQKKNSIKCVMVTRLFADNKKNHEFISRLSKKKIKIYDANSEDFDMSSSLKTPQGILAVVEKKKCSPLSKLEIKNFFGVLCDNIQDPGNLGAIIRTSAAFGVRAVLLIGENADIYHPRVIRASSGHVLDIPIYPVNVSELNFLREKGIKLIVSQLNHETGLNINEIKNLKLPFITVFGSEGKGVSQEVLKLADDFFYIPMCEKVESLNVATAAAITLYAFSLKIEQ